MVDKLGIRKDLATQDNYNSTVLPNADNQRQPARNLVGRNKADEIYE